MNPIAYIELVSVLACGLGVVFLVRGWNRTRFLRAVSILFLTLLLLMLFYSLSLFMEWSGLAERYHWHMVEDLAGVFIPFTWAFALYALVKNAVEDDLRTTRNRFRNLVESTSDWIWEVDAEGHYTYVSPQVEHLLGYRPEEMIGKTPFDFMPPEEAERVRAIFKKHARRRRPFYQFENTNLHKDGHEVILETNGNPILDRRRNLRGYRGVDRDITNRKVAEQITGQRQAELDSIFTASPAGIALVRDRKLVRGNDRFLEIAGYGGQDIKEIDARSLYLNEADYEAVGRKYQQAIEDGMAALETRWVRPDNAVIDVVEYLSPLDRDDPDKGYAVVVQDITALKAARKEAESEKSKARLYLDVAGVIIVVLDTEGRVKLLNKRGCEILGCTAEEAVGVDWFLTFVPSSHRAITRNMFTRLIQGKGKNIEYFEHPILTGHGEEYLISWHNVLLRDDDGNISGLIASGEDVTERRAAERAVRDSEERLRVALSAANMGTWRYEPDTNRFTRSAGANVMLGLVEAESTQSIEDFYNYVHPDDRKPAQQELQRAVTKNDMYFMRFRIVLPGTGEVRWVLAQGKPFYDYNGKLEYVTGVLIDVTERQTMVHALEESERRFRAAADYTYDWESWIDPKGKLEWINPAVERMTGYSVEECMQMDDYPLQLIDEQDRDRVATIMKEALKGSSGNDEQFRFKTKAGEVHWGAMSWQPINDKQGQSLGFRSSIRDITQRKQAQTALAESEERFRRIVEDQTEFIVRWQPDGTRTFVNDAYCKYFGLSKEEALNSSFMPLICEEDREKISQKINSLTPEHPVASSEHRVIRRDGSIGWNFWTDRAFFNDKGEVLEYQSIGRDITERKQAERALAESERRYRNFIHLAAEGIARFEFEEPMPLTLPHAEQIEWIGHKGILAECNEVFARMYGYPSADEFVGATIFDLWNDQDVATEVIGQLIRDGYQWANAETHEITQDGKEKYFLNNMISIIEDNCLKRHWLSQMDITEKVRNRETLLFTQFAVDHANEEAYWMRKDAKFIYVNEKACNKLGYTQEELLTMGVPDIDPDFPEDIWADHWKKLRKKKALRFESHHKTKDGHVFPVEISANFVSYDGQEYVCAFARDITDRRVAEQTRELLMQQLADRNDELQSIVFTAAHDLRTPLVNISGFTGELEKGLKAIRDLLADQPLNEKAAQKIDYLFESDTAESMRFIKSGAQQMDLLLDGLMRLSRVGSAPLTLAAVDMSELLQSVVEGLQYQINQHGVEISMQPDLPDCTGDATLLDQVFTNVVDNAIKYRHPDRPPVIEIRAEVQDDSVEYAVVDNGIGIDASQQEKVFELFHQLRPHKTQGGQGLGLTIVRRILDRMHGSVRMDSTPDVGTTVYVKLPRA